MGAEETQADRDRGYSQPSGHFVRGILQNITQQADLAQIRRKARDGASNQCARFAAGVELFGIIRSRREPGAEGLLRCKTGLLKRNILPFPPLTDQIYRSIRRDARNPGVEVVFSFVLLARKLAEARKRLQKGFLTGVFGICRVARQTQGAPVKSRSVGQDHFGKGIAIP